MHFIEMHLSKKKKKKKLGNTDIPPYLTGI